MKTMSKKKLKIFLISILVVVLVGIAAVVVYLITPYPVEDQALEILNQSDVVSREGDIITISSGETETAIIFYPGAKVESAAYLPLFEKLVKQTGITCYLVEMPFNLAVLDSTKAQEVISQNQDIKNWYMSGHSLGGSMASAFASDNQDIIDGVIVMGSYVYGEFPTEKSLTVYGTLNAEIANGIDYTDNIVIIEGGNHAAFGNYGKQLGDPVGEITAKQQQDETILAVTDFLISQNAI